MGRTVCPVLTESQVIDDQVHCIYTSLAYGLLAAAVLLILILMLMAICCCCFLQRRSKHARCLSHDNTSIGEYPYQPLARNAEGYSNYGTVDSGIDDIRSPSQSQNGSIAERLSQQHDTSSVASSRASMNPNYDETSLNHRSAVIGNRPVRLPIPELHSQPNRTDRANAERKGSSLSNSSQKKNPQSKPDGLYASVDVAGLASSRPLTGQKATKSKTRGSLSSNDSSQKAAEGISDELSVADGPDYAALEEPEVGSTEPNQSDSEGIDESQVKKYGDVDYAVLEPPLPDLPDMDGNTDPLSPVMAGGNGQGFGGSEESSEEERYLSLFPPRDSTDGQSTAEVNSVPDNSTHEPRKRLESRADYEGFLTDQLTIVPENERNGAFLVRESVSTPECKVLTVFCKKAGSTKEIYNFKICFSETGQVHLAKGKVYVPDVDSLLQYLMENQDMLPCVLTQQLYIDYGNAVA